MKKGGIPVKNLRTRSLLALLCDLAAVILVVVSEVSFYLFGAEGNMFGAGPRSFRYFTIDSNILAALAVLPAMVYAAKTLRGGETSRPGWVTVLKFVGTAAVMLTFAVVMVFLGPLCGYGPMLDGHCLELHLICPILFAVSFCLLEPGQLSRRAALCGLIPTAVYGVVYAVMVVGTGGWPDFYFFNRNGLWPLTFVIVLLGSAAVCFLLRRLHNACDRRAAREKTSDKTI